MTEPTKEQIKEFWEWCGFTRLEYLDRLWYQRLEVSLPLALPIDLNNLFKYAVPKIWVCDIKLEEGIFWCVKVAHPELGEGKANNEDFALALFWALWQVKENK